MVMRPEMAVWVARIATGWSRLEEKLGILIVQLLGTNAHTGMKMYQALSSSAAQKAVLRAVANDQLSAAMVAELETILLEYKKVGRKRNDIVHGHWGFSDEHPNDLVWTDSKEDLLAHSEFWAGWRSFEEEQERFDFASAWTRKRQHVLYGALEFESILDGMRNVFGKLAVFTMACDKFQQAKRDQAGLGCG